MCEYVGCLSVCLFILCLFTSYKSQELMADGCHGNSSSWYRVLKDTQDKHRNTFQHEYLAPLRNNFTLVTTGHSHTYPPILTHSLTHSHTHSLTHSHTHSLTHMHTHSLTHPPTHSLTYSLIHPLFHPLSLSLTHSLTLSPILPQTRARYITRPCPSPCNSRWLTGSSSPVYCACRDHTLNYCSGVDYSYQGHRSVVGGVYS